MIAENIYDQANDQGQEHLIMGEIVDHYSYEYTVIKEDSFITLVSNKHWFYTTKVWQILVDWKDSNCIWDNLKDIK